MLGHQTGMKCFNCCHCPHPNGVLRTPDTGRAVYTYLIDSCFVDFFKVQVASCSKNLMVSVGFLH